MKTRRKEWDNPPTSTGFLAGYLFTINSMTPCRQPWGAPGPALGPVGSSEKTIVLVRVYFINNSRETSVLMVALTSREMWYFTIGRWIFERDLLQRVVVYRARSSIPSMGLVYLPNPHTQSMVYPSTSKYLVRICVWTPKHLLRRSGVPNNYSLGVWRIWDV